ncbi:DNA-binding transcriptional regulator, MerR family [Thermomonospora echinospora]|uniref:DNA-binding transcriptional regulator, MerR family n=1 Tax=Thermomonospora echinospora TaxID=1992 RepID=A0A1H6CVI8_9ACTN|nr:MerR family transcriptional regulator [Thermomonospora echinospora]SEG77041.1 DNA-binding transcriptional regulator, MerR family [Thermomonospora echinospora]
MADYRIDELAHEAGTTVRNIRAYQDRGLLPPPRLEGRVGYYDDSHLARLRLIGQLLARGYTFAIIKELLLAWEHGKDVSEVLGLEKVLTDPWSDEIPGQIKAEELVDVFGAGLSDAEVGAFLERAVTLGLIEPEGDHYRVPSPRLLHVGGELVAAGIPLEAVLDIAEQIRDDCEVIAGRFVGLVNEHVFDRLGADPAPGGEEPAQLAAIVRRMRPLVKMVVEPFIARAMETQTQEALGARLELIRDHLPAEAESTS